MSKVNKSSLGIFAATAIFLAGCATPPPAPAPVAAAPEACNKFPGAPGWVCDEPVEGLDFSAVGSAAKTEAGPGFMKQMAATDARVQLAQQLKVEVKNMIKQFVETTGAGGKETVDRVNTSVTKQITNETLQGSKIYKSTTAPDGTLYVLVGVDMAAGQKLKENLVKTSMNNDAALWQKFQAGKAQDELAAEIAKMGNK